MEVDHIVVRADKVRALCMMGLPLIGMVVLLPIIDLFFGAGELLLGLTLYLGILIFLLIFSLEALFVRLRDFGKFDLELDGRTVSGPGPGAPYWGKRISINLGNIDPKSMPSQDYFSGFHLFQPNIVDRKGARIRVGTMFYNPRQLADFLELLAKAVRTTEQPQNESS